MWMLLHGFTGSPRSWDPVVDRAALELEVSCPPLFGHQRDWRERDVSSFADEVRRLCARAASGRPPRLIAGYSLGARVALGMLATAPELFDGALLIGVHPGFGDGEQRRARRELDAERARLLRTDGVDAFVSHWEEQPLFDTQATLGAEAQARQREIRLSHDAEGLACSLDVLGLGAMPCYADALCATSVPVTLMTGADDTKFRDLAADLADRCAHVESILVEGAGHNLILEAREAVAAALCQVERQVGRGARR